MKSIKDIPEDNIRKLAETMKSSGLAASETEAIRMAYNMAKTSSKATPSSDMESVQEQTHDKISEPKTEKKEQEKPVELQERQAESDEYGDEFIVQDIVKSEGSALEKEGEHKTNTEEATTERSPLGEEKHDAKKESQPETTKEITEEEEKPKKNVSRFEESKVDLNSMFKYKG